MVRRTRAQMEKDRKVLLQYVTDCQKLQGIWRVQQRPWMKASDVQALVDQGKLVRTVEKEWDTQKNQPPGLGGSGVVMRHRAYLRLPD